MSRRRLQGGTRAIRVPVNALVEAVGIGGQHGADGVAVVRSLQRHHLGRRCGRVPMLPLTRLPANGTTTRNGWASGWLRVGARDTADAHQSRKAILSAISLAVEPLSLKKTRCAQDPPRTATVRKSQRATELVRRGQMPVPGPLICTLERAFGERAGRRVDALREHDVSIPPSGVCGLLVGPPHTAAVPCVCEPPDQQTRQTAMARTNASRADPWPRPCVHQDPHASNWSCGSGTSAPSAARFATVVM